MTPDFSSVPTPSAIFHDAAAASANLVAFLEGPAAAANGLVYFTDIAGNRILC